MSQAQEYWDRWQWTWDGWQYQSTVVINGTARSTAILPSAEVAALPRPVPWPDEMIGVECWKRRSVLARR